jgi:hypothetical protein
MSNDPSIKSNAVAQMHARNKKIDALLGGTEAMRKAGKSFLPQEDAESDTKYARRLNMSVLYPAYEQTVSQMVGRTFAKPLIVEKVADGLKDYLSNIDLRDNDIDGFCSKWFYDAMAHGSSYVIVDFPIAGDNRSINDDKQLGLRPYVSHVPFSSVLGWRSEMRDNVEVCTQFRYRSVVIEPDGKFGEKQIEQVTVMTPGHVTVYRQGDDGWYQHSDAEQKIDGQLLSCVPVVAFTPERTGFFEGKPVLENLADLNIRHWQARSDQDYLVHFISMPLMFYLGESEIEKIVAGTGTMLRLAPGEQMGFIEHSGRAVEAGWAGLDRIEADMKVAGAKLLTRTKLAMTDSQAKEEQSKEVSLLRHYANLFESAIDAALKLMSMWKSSKEPSHVEISGNLESDDTVEGMNVVMTLNTNDIISNQTTFEEAKRRGVISSQASWEEEVERLENEQAAITPPLMDFSDDKRSADSKQSNNAPA